MNCFQSAKASEEPIFPGVSSTEEISTHLNNRFYEDDKHRFSTKMINVKGKSYVGLQTMKFYQLENRWQFDLKGFFIPAAMWEDFANDLREAIHQVDLNLKGNHAAIKFFPPLPPFNKPGADIQTTHSNRFFEDEKNRFISKIIEVKGVPYAGLQTMKLVPDTKSWKYDMKGFFLPIEKWNLFVGRLNIALKEIKFHIDATPASASLRFDPSVLPNYSPSSPPEQKEISPPNAKNIRIWYVLEKKSRLLTPRK